MNIFILGSEGQIGQYLVEAANVRHEVRCLDLALGSHHDLRTRHNPWLAEGLNWADMVYFLSFDVGGSSYLAEHQFSFKYLDNNVKILHNTFRALKRTGKPFLFASSQMANMTNSSYGTLKNLGEFFTRSLQGINVRFWNVYGKEADREKFHVITDFIEAARDGEIRMRTDGLEKRQFLYGADAAQGLITLGERYDELRPEVWYDITSFEWTSILEVAHLIGDLSPRPVDILPGWKKDATQIRMNEPYDEIQNYWKPTTSLAEGVQILMEQAEHG